jgi:nicotinamide-nucleotide adenylyltransferase
MGVIHGRFQMLHNDHLRYLLAGKARCEHLVVGITDPDPSLSKFDPADPNRSRPLSNPLTYFERYTMVKRALLESGLEITHFSVVPFPIHFPEKYGSYVPLDGIFFLTIYDRWGRKKLEQFRRLGLNTEILWEKTLKEKGLTGTEIRNRMIKGEPWVMDVPKSTAMLVKEWGISSRLREMAGE